jgi:methyltransferase
MASQGFSEKESSTGMRAMVVLHACWYVTMILESTLLPRSIPYSVQLVALAIFLGAQLLRFWTLRTLGMYWNISVMTTDEAAPRFVSDGPYRFIRHPNYLVVITELATLPLLGGALLTSVCFTALNALLLRRRIALEEAHLFAIPGYQERLGMLGRLIPRMSRAIRQ